MKWVMLFACLVAVLSVGCASGTVSEQDAQNFSKTPDGKDDGRDEVNNAR